MDVFVARQPIFDADGNVHGYELLYRGALTSESADGRDVNQMSRDVIIQSFLGIGLERLTGGGFGFLNFGREMLVQGYYDLLNPQSVVIELLESVEADDVVLEACRRLVGMGYQLALDDYEPGSSHEALLPLASVVKVDVLNRPAAEIASVIEPLKQRPVSLLAERVETAADHATCRELGFELFQGYFFSRPELVSKQGAPVQQTTMMELMNLLHDETAADQSVEAAFRRDPQLSYKLLRMVNAAAHGVRGIESIQHGIRLLGRGPLRRWLALLLASSLVSRGGTDVELVRLAVLRARFCELLGESAQQNTMSGRLFILGLFSLMDALLEQPMEEVVERVDLTAAVREALLHGRGPYAPWLELISAYETGEWDRTADLCRQLEIDPSAVPTLYLDALNWAREQLHIADS